MWFKISVRIAQEYHHYKVLKTQQLLALESHLCNFAGHVMKGGHQTLMGIVRGKKTHISPTTSHMLDIIFESVETFLLSVSNNT